MMLYTRVFLYWYHTSEIITNLSGLKYLVAEFTNAFWKGFWEQMYIEHTAILKRVGMYWWKWQNVRITQVFLHKLVKQALPAHLYYSQRWI